MKRFFPIFLSVLLAIVVLIPACASANAVTMYVDTANRRPLNLRTYGSLNAGIITMIPYGASVTANTMGGDGTWVPVTYNGKSGYCMMCHLSYTKPGSSSGSTDLTSLFSSFTSSCYYATVTPTSRTGFVNMRWAPSLSAPVEDIYYYGSSLMVIAQNGTWAQVYDQSSNKCGFMMLTFMNCYGY